MFDTSEFNGRLIGLRTQLDSEVSCDMYNIQ